MNQGKRNWLKGIVGAIIGSPAGGILLGILAGLLIQRFTGVSEVVVPWEAGEIQGAPIWFLLAAAGGVVHFIILAVTDN